MYIHIYTHTYIHIQIYTYLYLHKKIRLHLKKAVCPALPFTHELTMALVPATSPDAVFKSHVTVLPSLSRRVMGTHLRYHTCFKRDLYPSTETYKRAKETYTRGLCTENEIIPSLSRRVMETNLIHDKCDLPQRDLLTI